MLNILLNRYYINNANRSIALTETQQKMQALLVDSKIGASPASGSGTSPRGKDPHETLQRELQGIWARHLNKEVEQRYCQGNFCRKN